MGSRTGLSRATSHLLVRFEEINFPYKIQFKVNYEEEKLRLTPSPKGKAFAPASVCELKIKAAACH